MFLLNFSLITSFKNARASAILASGGTSPGNKVSSFFFAIAPVIRAGRNLSIHSGHLLFRSLLGAKVL